MIDIRVFVELLKEATEGEAGLDAVLESLDTALRECEEQLAISADFREQLGESVEFWRQISKLYDIFRTRLSENDMVNLIPLMTNLLRVTRNILAGNSENQEKTLGYGLNIHIENILLFCAIQHNSGDNQYTPVFRMGTQALSNLITSNEKVQNILWSNYMARGEKNDILNTLIDRDDDAILTALLMLVHNCIFESMERSELLIQSPIGEQLVKNILERAEVLFEDETSKAFELIYAVIGRLIDNRLFPALFVCLQSDIHSKTLRSTQITLLKLLDSKLHSSKHPSVPETTVQTLLQTFLTTSANFVKFMAQTAAQIEEVEDEIVGSDPVEEIEMENEYAGLVLLLQILGMITSIEDQEGRKVKKILLDGGGLKGSIELLGRADKILPRVTMRKSCMKKEESERAMTGILYIKRDAVRLIGNLAFKSKEAQDEIRQLGGIQLLLNQCNIDDANPYLREYGLFAVRNALEENRENQGLVSELQPISAAQSSVLEEVGYRAELVDGMVHVRKK